MNAMKRQWRKSQDASAMKNVTKDLALQSLAESSSPGSRIDAGGSRVGGSGSRVAGTGSKIEEVGAVVESQAPAPQVEESSSSDDEFLEVAENKAAGTSGVNKTEQRRANIRVHELDQRLLELEEDQLEEMLEGLSNELSNLEVRKIELENLDRQLDEDKATLSEAIRKGVHEKEALRREIEDLRLEAKNIRETLLKTNKDRQGDEATLASLQKNLISLKDHYEDTVWNRVDLEDMLRKLDRDLVIIKNKQAEVGKANAATAALEQKLAVLTSVATTKMKEASKIDSYRENFRRRLDALAISLHHHSSDRADMAAEMDHQRRLIEFRNESRNASERIITQTSDLVICLQEDLERTMGSQELFFSEIETSFASLRARCDQNAKETSALQSFFKSSLKQRLAAATHIQKVNSALERYCVLLRNNKQFTQDDIKQIFALTSDLDLTLASLKEYESIRHVGVERVMEVDSMHQIVDQVVLKRVQLSARTRASTRTLKRCQQLYAELLRENQETSALLAAGIAERKKLEAQLPF